MSAESDRHWTETVLGGDIDTHDVEPETFAEWHDGIEWWILDEGWGGAWIETDTVVEVRR